MPTVTTAEADRPLVLLDVDGVLNAYERDGASAGWEVGHATADGCSWKITFCPAVIIALGELHESGRVELRWLTTWGHDANAELRVLLGLPELLVAGTHGGDSEGPGGSVVSGDALAAVTPSAPVADLPEWWKWDVVQRLRAAEPTRRLVWIDDELQPDSVFTYFAKQVGITVIGPSPEMGLGLDDLVALG